MGKKIIVFTAIILEVVIAIKIFGFTTKDKLSVDGAWSIVEVQIVKSDGTHTLTFPREGLAIFSNNYYSICWTSHTATGQSWQIADSTKLSRFNQSIINTGSFELRDTILTTKATFGLNPNFSNGFAKFKCAFVDDTLILRGLSVFSSDNIAHPVYAGGSYIVTKLLKVNNK